ncbi:MAG: acyl carrier protein [Povalibacter sp.]
MKDVEQTVLRLFAEKLCVRPVEIPLDAHIVRDLGATSLDEVEMILVLEDEFQIEVPDEYASQIGTVQDLIEAINERLMLASRYADGSNVPINR